MVLTTEHILIYQQSSQVVVNSTRDRAGSLVVLLSTVWATEKPSSARLL